MITNFCEKAQKIIAIAESIAFDFGHSSVGSEHLLLSFLKVKDTKVKKLLENQNIKADYEINYGVNYFPEKEYKGITYEEGNYESIVIKLGEGTGENFWCVLFPPLCLLEVEEKNNDDIEYTSFIKEIIDKYF